MRWVRATHGVSLAAQARDIVILSRSGQRLEPKDYFLYGLFREGFDRARQRSYVSTRSGMALNRRLAPLAEDSAHGLLFNKLLAGLLLERAGYPVAPIRAIHAAGVSLPGLRTLADAAAIAGWLREPGALPAFGKPVFSSMGLGAASLVALSGDGAVVTLGDGREIEVEALAAEIVAKYPLGYIFQPLLRQHPDVEAVTGPTVGVLRVVTLLAPDGPETLYTVLKLPPPGAMTDGTANRTPNGMGLVDWTSGRILRAQHLARMATTPLTHSLVTGKPLDEARLPFTQQAVALCGEVHRLFQAHGILGFDIALTADGPVIGEINTRPYHSVYQTAADRGVLNEEFRPRLEAVQALIDARRPATRLPLAEP